MKPKSKPIPKPVQVLPYQGIAPPAILGDVRINDPYRNVIYNLVSNPGPGGIFEGTELPGYDTGIKRRTIIDDRGQEQIYYDF